MFPPRVAARFDRFSGVIRVTPPRRSPPGLDELDEDVVAARDVPVERLGPHAGTAHAPPCHAVARSGRLPPRRASVTTITGVSPASVRPATPAGLARQGVGRRGAPIRLLPP